MEVWVKIEESKHVMVSNKGRIKRLEHRITTTCGKHNKPHVAIVPEKILGGTKLSPKGYPRVNIGGKVQFIHRLIAKYFIPNPENKPQINHKDGNKLNNCVENLEWITNQENRNHAVLTGLHKGPDRTLTPSQELEVYNKYQQGKKQRELACEYNILQQTVSKTILRVKNSLARTGSTNL